MDKQEAAKIDLHKNKLYHKYIKKRDPFWYNRYTQVKKDLKIQLCDAKKKHFAKFFEQNANNSKKIWSGINGLISKKKNAGAESIFLTENGKTSTNQTSVASKFNKYYTSVADNLIQNLGETNTKYQDYLKNPNKSTIYINETDYGEVSEILSSLDITKAGDLFAITPKLIKLAGTELTENLTQLFNKSLSTGVFPDVLKLAKVYTCIQR